MLRQDRTSYQHACDQREARLRTSIPGSKLEREVNKVAELEMSKLMEFVEDTDPNLKYLGLCGLLKLVVVLRSCK